MYSIRITTSHVHTNPSSVSCLHAGLCRRNHVSAALDRGLGQTPYQRRINTVSTPTPECGAYTYYVKHKKRIKMRPNIH